MVIFISGTELNCINKVNVSRRQIILPADSMLYMQTNEEGIMVEVKDRRSFDRVLCQGATVLIYKKYWYQSIRHRVLKSIALFTPQTSHIQNMSKSGLLILSKIAFKKGDNICLVISSPGIKGIMIKAIVIWNTSNAMKEEHIGIQFLAFSNWKKYNSFFILKQLNFFLSKNQSLLMENSDDNNKDIKEQLYI